MIKQHSPLAELYETLILEQHHFSYTVTLLNDPKLNIFGTLTSFPTFTPTSFCTPPPPPSPTTTTFSYFHFHSKHHNTLSTNQPKKQNKTKQNKTKENTTQHKK